jgi:hypothetical protein
MSGEAPETIEARLKVYDRIGSRSIAATVLGLLGMTICAIWAAPWWLWNTFTTFAAGGGLLTAVILFVYSGAESLLEKAKAMRDANYTR